MIPDKPLYDSLKCFDREIVLCNRYPTFGPKDNIDVINVNKVETQNKNQDKPEQILDLIGSL